MTDSFLDANGDRPAAEQTGTSDESGMMTEKAGRPVVLSIAGFDPSSGAGVTADLKVFAAHGLYGMACITALTVQSTRGVRAVEAVSGTTVEATLAMLREDVTFSGIKLGMLATGEICRVVYLFLNLLPGVPVVLDPVLASSSGKMLLDKEGIRFLQENLLARADWITPNLDEISILTGMAVSIREEVPAAAARLREMAVELGNRKLNILVTGGHLETPEDYLLSGSGDSYWIPGQRVETNATHGTGCALSSALLCQVVKGVGADDATKKAKEYVTAALRAAYTVGGGKGPMHHLFRLSGGLCGPMSEGTCPEKANSC